jgi:hypothetical protein
MSINGINNNPLLNSLGPLVRSNSTQSVQNGKTPAARPATERAGIAERTAVTARPTIASQPTAVPTEAPAGTDPALWNVLTTEERAFFSKSASLGPLTYGKIKNATMPTPPAMRGGRLDVRA